ncbi:MAG: helix-turn-helix domain-containing protein [Paeniglutamicibacter sp.]
MPVQAPARHSPTRSDAAGAHPPCSVFLAALPLKSTHRPERGVPPGCRPSVLRPVFCQSFRSRGCRVVDRRLSPRRTNVVNRGQLGNSIRELRARKNNMTQVELAARVGVTRQTIIAIEQGK